MRSGSTRAHGPGMRSSPWRSRPAFGRRRSGPSRATRTQHDAEVESRSQRTLPSLPSCWHTGPGCGAARRGPRAGGESPRRRRRALAERRQAGPRAGPRRPTHCRSVGKNPSHSMESSNRLSSRSPPALQAPERQPLCLTRIAHDATSCDQLRPRVESRSGEPLGERQRIEVIG
jgi:hypothetical protein